MERKYKPYFDRQYAHTWNRLPPPSQLFFILLTLSEAPVFQVYLIKSGIIENMQKSILSDI